ncbi:hypothetical protein JZ751_005352, partial [Albula glossodonta]
MSPQPPTSLPLYLIVSLGSVSFLFLVAILVLAAIKGYRDRHSIRGYSLSLSACCGFRSEASTEVLKNSNLNLEISAAAKLQRNCAEGAGSGSVSRAYCYKMCLTPDSTRSDFMFLKPYSQAAGAPQNNAQNHGAGNITSIAAQPRQRELLYAAECVVPYAVECVEDRTALSPLCTANFKTSPPVAGVPSTAWTPRYVTVATQHPPELPPDYQHNVYNPSSHCSHTLGP